jgi:hypothetical protein
MPGFNLFTPFTNKWEGYIDTYITPVAKQLYHWAHYAAYQVMVAKVKTAATQSGLSEEIARMNVLLSHFIMHLETFAPEHINETRSGGSVLLDTDIIGTFNDMRLWQDAGYNPISVGAPPRTAATYAQRLRIWQDIFDGRHSVNGVPITYEKVLNARMSFGIENDNVPYWMLWNYGTAYRTGRVGYPSYAGIHFLEAGEASLPDFKSRAMTSLEIFSYNLFRRDRVRIPTELKDEAWREIYRNTYAGDRLL